jgi:two-component system sensor histidine kinase HydH
MRSRGRSLPARGRGNPCAQRRSPPYTAAVETVAPLFTALMCLTVALSSLLRGSKERLHQDFAFLSGVLSITFLCLFFLIVTDQGAWRYGVLVAALFVTPAVLQVYGLILRPFDPPTRHLTPFLYVAAVAQIVAIVILGSTHPAVLLVNGLLVFGGLTVGVIGLARVVGRIDRRGERDRLRYLLASGAFAVLAMGTEMLLLDWNFYGSGRDLLFPPIGSLAVAAHVYFLAQVINRQRLLDPQEVVSQLVVFVVMGVVLGSVYGVLVRLVGRGSGAFAEAVDTLIASILVIILYEPIRDAAIQQVDRLFARERHDQILALVDMKQRLPGLIEIEQLLDALFDGTLFTGRVDLSSLYLYDDRRDGFRLRRVEGHPEEPLVPAFPPRPFIDGFLAGRDWYLIDDLDTEVGLAGVASEPEWREGVAAQMGGLQADLCLPLRIGHTVVGVWNLRLKPGGQAFSTPELRLLRDVAERAAVLIDNSRAFETVKERERLAALGEMSAGLAHEIRNPLGAIKGAVQVIARPSASAEVQAEFLGIIREEVDRLDGVVTQFLDYARPVIMIVEPVPPDLLLRGVLAMVRAQGLPMNVVVDYRADDSVPPVPMDVEKLKQVVLNIVLNGIDAMGVGGGTLTVRAHLASDRRISSLRSQAPGGAEVRVKRGAVTTSDAVELTFEDEGVGVKPDDAAKLFIPFFTTKTGGTGLGLAICERIMRGHGGEIEIVSVPGQGSRFTLRLPLPEPELDGEPTEFDRTPVGASGPVTVP